MVTAPGYASSSAAAAAARPDVGEAIAAVESLVAADTFPCAVLGVSDATGTLALHAVPGPRDRNISTDSVFFLASVTKPIVATAVMQLVDEGRLDVHEPVARYVPAFSGGLRDRVTPWHVLTHTSGLGDLDLERLRRGRPSYASMLARVCRQEPAFEPGSRYAYASDPFYLLAEIISRLTGMTFARALAARVLVPLGMRDAVFDARARRGRTVQVHGVPLRNPVVRELTIRFLAAATLPGGGLFATAEDLLRFGRSLLPRAGGDAAAPRLLSGPAIDEMTREQTAGILEILEDGATRDPHYALGWRKPDPAGNENGGLGLEGVALPASAASFTHGGVSGTRLWIDPERGMVFVLLGNRWGMEQTAHARVLAAVYRGWPAIVA